MNLNRLHPLRMLFPELAELIRKEHMDYQRATGRSTIQALKYLVEALENPYLPILVQDHHGTDNSDRYLLSMARDMASKLGLLGLVFNLDKRTVTFGERTE